MRRHDVQSAIFADELEGSFDLLLAGVGFELDLVAEITAFRVELGGLGYVVGERVQIGDAAESLQVAQEGQRVQAVAQHIGIGPQGDVPEVAADAVLFEHVDPSAALVPNRQPGVGDGRRLGGSRCIHVEAGVELAHQLLAQFGVGVDGLAALVHRIQHPTDVVAAVEQQRQHGGLQVPFAIAHLVQQALHHMGEADQQLQAEQAGRALDGMGRAEDGVDPVGAEPAGLDLQQRLLHGRE
ncbi:hypothetical protein D9M69_467750 [compost metagenome]